MLGRSQVSDFGTIGNFIESILEIGHTPLRVSKEVKVLPHLKDCSEERVPGLSAGTMPPMKVFIGVQPYRQKEGLLWSKGA